MTLVEYVLRYTERGECKCGRCFDVGTTPDPIGHTADIIFFKVALKGKPTINEFKELTRSYLGQFNQIDPFDGQEHNYMELGAWIGDQGLALEYMGMGYLLGLFELLTPRLLVGLSEDLVQEYAAQGLVAIKAKKEKEERSDTFDGTISRP
jgi:hypothetical protein